MLANHHHHYHHHIQHEDEEEIDRNSKKAPNSFLLYKTIRRQDSKYISSQQLMEEWSQMSIEQKAEFQNQSKCIQFTLDIDNRRQLPKIIVPPPSSMVIPNDYSIPSREYKSSLYQPLKSPSTKHMPYSAAAEAAALDFNPVCHNNNNNNDTSSSIKKKYGILPQKVKRPPNAYLLFNRDMRRQLHDVNRGLSSGEISKSISARWKQLTIQERDYYIKEEAKLKQQHNNQHSNFIYTRRSKAEMKEAGSLKQQQQKNKTVKLNTTTTTTTIKRKSLTPPQNESGRDPRGRKKKKQDDTLPKHPMSGYLHFAKEMRPIMKKRYPDARLVEISKHIGAQWRSMSEKELQPWIDIANLDKERYAKEMKERISNQERTREDDDTSSCHSHHTLILHYDKHVDDLDSHTIATVAQMVNQRSY